MSKPRDAAKERYWRDVLRRFGRSGLGTKRFCAQEGVPEHQFHWWRRRLRQQGQHQPRQRTVAVNRAQDASGDAQGSPFLPVLAPLSLGVPIEVVHPRGHVIRVPAFFDAAALGRILATLDLADHSAGEAPR
jgi:hypothetical protein